MSFVAASPQADVLDQLFQGLKSRNAEVRAQAAFELQRYVRSLCGSWTYAYIAKASNTIPELSSDAVAKLWEELINKIFELVHSQSPAEKLGGILAIGASRH